jgi:hypothetical protein
MRSSMVESHSGCCGLYIWSHTTSPTAGSHPVRVERGPDVPRGLKSRQAGQLLRQSEVTEELTRG